MSLTPLEVKTGIQGEIAWIRVIGYLDGSNRHILRREGFILIEQNVKTLIIDLYECTFFDSNGLMTLVTLSKAARASGGSIYLQNLRDDLRTIFQVTKLDTLFEIGPSLEFDRKLLVVLPNFTEINDELVEYFSKHPESLVELHWRKFEELLDVIFRNNGFRTVLGTGNADGGIDLRLIQSDECGDLITLVQAKKYKKPIRLEAVQAFCAVIDDEKANRGLFVTTSRYLPSARQFAERQRHRLVLADSSDVARWCDRAVRQLTSGSSLMK